MFQIGTSSWGGARKAPYAFTEHGVAMLASLLNSETAISVSVQIVRLFIKLRDILLIHNELLGKFEALENTVAGQQEDLNTIFQTLDALSENQEKDLPREPIGFQIKRQLPPTHES